MVTFSCFELYCIVSGRHIDGKITNNLLYLNSVNMIVIIHYSLFIIHSLLHTLDFFSEHSGRGEDLQLLLIFTVFMGSDSEFIFESSCEIGQVIEPAVIGGF